MRLHRLEITAFGPFAGTEQIDFDALNEAGLFLLTGATGAGKTSVLDAVCFALYGVVPGVRGVKTLKSQHAEDRARPEVVLDFGVGDRRFVLRRSPEWSRPKRRGEGSTSEKASASLIEIVGGEEHLLSPRAAEVGLQVSSLIGMQATQFQQVAMLPQGEFQRFLQASSQDRHDVLQQLFQTDRFARIETWVQERSRTLKEQAGQRQQDVQRVLDTLAERAATDLPETFDPAGLSDAVAEHTVQPWADDVEQQARLGLEPLRQAHDAARSVQTATRTRLEAARLRARLQRRRAEAVAERATLEATLPEASRARRLLDAAARAGACGPVLALLERSDREVASAAAETVRRTESLRRLADAGDLAALDLDPSSWESPEGLASLARSAESRLTDVRVVLPRAAHLVDGLRSLESLRSQVAALQVEQTDCAESVAELPLELGRLRAQLEAMRARAARAELLALRLADARARHAAAIGLPDARARQVAADDAVRTARDLAADARDHVQILTQRRLAGMAAELAGALQDGVPCQVCGSADHPARAALTTDAVTEAEQREADEVYLRAQQTLVSAAQRATEAAREQQSLTGLADGLDPSEAAAAVTDLAAELTDAEEALRALPAAESAVAEAEISLSAATTRAAALASEVATSRARLEAAEAELLAARSTLDEVLGPETDPALVPLIEQRLTSFVELVAALRTSVEEHHRATSRQQELLEQALSTASMHGFSDVASVREAALDPGDQRRLTALLDERATTLARLDAVLQDAEVAGIDDDPPPDVAAAEAACAEADEAAAAAARAFHQQEQLVDAVTALRGRLSSALVAWEPLRHDSSRAEAMSRLVRGMGSDNHLQMRLSSYVLARRLDQVLDAANERLTHMRDQRYLLQRTGRAARRTGQAGLGLEVVDQWTGDVRDPATLSGGETFVVSLALALGLADVVTQEAGGTLIETLFVDEGFGSLDADTLDDVMDRLDGLRAGGRTVGVVSHVSELRARIPHQLHVHKSPRGSTVSMRTLVG